MRTVLAVLAAATLASTHAATAPKIEVVNSAGCPVQITGATIEDAGAGASYKMDLEVSPGVSEVQVSWAAFDDSGDLASNSVFVLRPTAKDWSETKTAAKFQENVSEVKVSVRMVRFADGTAWPAGK